jgi:hypothetical protein
MCKALLLAKRQDPNVLFFPDVQFPNIAKSKKK